MHDRLRQPALATILALTFTAAIPRLAVLAQDATPALAAPELARSLAAKALASLERGEHGVDDKARLASYREGLHDAEAAVAADDDNADAHFAVFANRGRIMVLEGAVANPFNLYFVTRELNRALELNPNHADALAAKGDMLRQLPRLLGGSLSEAAQYLKRAVDIDPGAIGARIELADVYRDLGHPELGIPYLANAAEVARHDGKYELLTEIQNQLQLLHSGASAALDEGR